MFISDSNMCIATTIRPRLFGKIAIAALSALVAFWSAAAKADTELPWLKSKTVLIESPAPGTVPWAQTFYTQGTGTQLMNVACTSDSSDVYENWQRRFSDDNGQSWSAWEAIAPPPAPPTGVHRRYEQPGWVDPNTGRMLMMVNDGIFPTGAPTEGYYRWQLHYRVSTDGGQTYDVDEQVIQQGGYTSTNPVEGVYLNYNAMMIGASSCMPIATRQEKVLVPVQISRSSAGYFDAAVLIGSWGDGLKMEWNLSERVATDNSHSTRGLFEPTVAEMPNGDVLMVCRGSNGSNTSLPGYKWYSTSDDGGLTWSDTAPWTFDNGSNFYSPSSCSQLLEHSNGKYYWIGNVSPTNPSGNSPRYPLVIGEVNHETFLLEKDSLVTIDAIGAGDNSSLQLSNFLAYEDRLTGDIVLQMTRFSSSPRDGDSYTYRIGVPMPEPSTIVLLISAAVGMLVYAWRKRTGIGN